MYLILFVKAKKAIPKRALTHTPDYEHNPSDQSAVCCLAPPDMNRKKTLNTTEPAGKQSRTYSHW